MTMTMNLGTLLVAMALLLSSSSVCAQDAVTQGIVLRKLATSWNVNFSDWGVNDDPCVGNWTGIMCEPITNSKVLAIELVTKNLGGSIAKDIGQLVYLERLDLTNNSIQGKIPVEIGKLVYLKHLDLKNNSIQGEIPVEIGQLVYLEHLDLTNNSIQGGIPSEIGQLTHLQVLTLDGNQLTAPPPQTLLHCDLRELSMHANKIVGKLPSWIGQMVQLVKLDMYTNLFWGGLPPEYGNLRNLKILELWENQLSGNIPNEWQGMTSIESLRLGHNYLTGSLPEWLFKIPTLNTMNLPRNQFVGQFPNLTSLLRNGESNFTKLGLGCNFFKGNYPQQYYDTLPPGVNISIQYIGNCFDNETDTNPTINRLPNVTQNTPAICSRSLDCNSFYEQAALNPGNCAPCPSAQELIDVAMCVCGKYQASQGHFPLGAVVGGVVGGVVVTISALLLMLIYYKRSTQVKYPDFGRIYEGRDEPWIVPKGLRRFKLQELEKATDKFDEKCFTGSGGFGKVYRGVLDDGSIVALKCASQHSAQGQTQFRNELTLLSRLHHRNLVKLEGFCDDDGLQILVYEFMENGDLCNNLFGKNGKLPLNSNQRFEVVIGIARGLDYLHFCADPAVIHRDIKLSNVLLNHDMVPKLADFGVSRISPEIDTHVSTAPIGTRGYLDPDYFRTNQLTTASDVYAFGIVLLEIVTGLPVIDYTRLDAAALDAWAHPRFEEGGIRAIVDRKMNMGYNEHLFTDMAKLALQCADHDRLQRPSMKDVLAVLEPYAKTTQLRATSHHLMEWSISHFKNRSLFEAETSEQSQDSSQSTASESQPLNPGPSHNTVGPALLECFTELTPR